MYTRCLFCKQPLGANEVIEPFPVGRTLAFDAALGRLWVVCPGCARWNLSPLEERWEAIEECEARFRDTRLRVSTENIGLARLPEGLHLVRVGPALRPEMAAWRYGGTLVRRAQAARRRLIWDGSLSLATGVATAAGVATVAPPLVIPALIAAPVLAFGVVRDVERLLRGGAPKKRLAKLGGRIALADGRLLSDDGRIVQAAIRTGGAGGDVSRWLLTVATIDERAELEGRWPASRHNFEGREALHAAAVILAWSNEEGASSRSVQAAATELQHLPSSADYFAHAESAERRRGEGYRNLWEMPPVVRLAMEMAANEESERRAMHGELRDLEARWREAEEIAAIADRLFLPPEIDGGPDRLRATDAEPAP